MRRLGFTITELLVTGALTVVLVGSLLGMFVFSAKKAEAATVETAAYNDASRLMDDIASKVSNATEVSVYTGTSGQFLRCTLPKNGIDMDGDGYPDRFNFSMVNNFGTGKYIKGLRVTYYRSNNTGSTSTPLHSASWCWRAWRNDDAVPTNADVDLTFASNRRDSRESAFPTVKSLSFSHDEANGRVLVRITATADSGDGEKDIVLERTIPYRKGQF
jgi:hypothetical protein